MTTQAPLDPRPTAPDAERSGAGAEPLGRPARVTTLGRSARGLVVPSAWQRARARRLDLEDPFVSWTASIALALVALFLRVWKLATPKEFEFDETYYAKDAWSLVHHGFVRGYPDTANQQILSGVTDHLFTNDVSMIVHPEVGKWLIGLGELTFGMTPFGWRIAAAVAGALMVLVMCRLARRITGSTTLGLVAGLLLMVDGLQFVLSRLALLDIFLALFTLCAVACVVNDRDWLRTRLAARTAGPVARGWGAVRGTLWRPWLLVGGVFFGLACGTKWTAVYPLAAFGLLSWAWSAGARRSFGVRRAWLRSIVLDALPAFGYLVVVGLVVYVSTWAGWLVHHREYEDHLSSTQYTQFSGSGHCEGETFVDDAPVRDARWPTADEPERDGVAGAWQALRSLWYYHQDVYTFHTHFLNCATHTYESKPSGWLLLNRPVGVAADTGIQPGDRGCTAPAGSDCLTQVILLGNPVIWWGGCLAALFALVMWIGARDWRFGVATVGLASTWLPWLLYDDRPIFLFYAVVALPFVVLALTLAIGAAIGRRERSLAGVIAAGTFVVLAVLTFAWFWPVYTDQLLTHREWTERIWFTRWI